MTKKKKLMVVLGAGASIELGMPSVGEVDKLFCKWAIESCKLANDETRSLYSYIRDEINSYYANNLNAGLRKETNFEEVLYVILQLSSILGDTDCSLPMNAFLREVELPEIYSFNKEKTVDGNDLRHLSSMLIDKLIVEFRERCKVVKTTKPTEFKRFENFIAQLNTDYDVAFVTLNYDNLVTQAAPSLFTGFSKVSGAFDPTSVYDRKNWGMIYHLHGSIHFDMQGDKMDMHAIKWNPDLNSVFSGNASGRNSQDTTEGIQLPTSAIVAGYGKTNQIQKIPFRTYYSQLDEITELADSALFLGYGFNDLHINNCFHSIRKRKIPVVIVDWAPDDQDPMQFRSDLWSYNLCKAIPVSAGDMATKQYRHAAPDIADLKANGEFEVSSNPDYPLVIWYGGFIDACKNYLKISTELG